MTEIRVLIADDHNLMRSGLKMLINTQPDLIVVGEAGDFPTARERIVELRPHVVTMDLSMPGGDAVHEIKELARDFPDVRILVLTMHDDCTMLQAVFSAGAIGYLVKSAADTELLTAARNRGEKPWRETVARNRGEKPWRVLEVMIVAMAAVTIRTMAEPGTTRRVHTSITHARNQKPSSVAMSVRSDTSFSPGFSAVKSRSITFSATGRE